MPPDIHPPERDADAFPTFAAITVQSEITRIIAINALALLIVVVAIARNILAPREIRLSWPWFLAPAAALLLGIILVSLLRRLAREGKGIPAWMWISNVVFESLI